MTFQKLNASRLAQLLCGCEFSGYVWQVVWKNVIIFSLLHLGALYGVYLCICEAKYITAIAAYLIAVHGGVGITAGAHRLWAHKSYKSKTSLKIVLVMLQSMALQNSILDWCRDHRKHHKYSETDADPHNAKRGFFFSHMGWLLIRKHQAVKANDVDMSDLNNDSVLRLQKRFYVQFVFIFSFLTPFLMGYFIFGESAKISFFVMVILRYIYSLHCTWLVNSAAHMYGYKPYDKSIGPVQNKIVSFFAIGEGWHNYHHVFPWDYRANELPFQMNLTGRYIHFWHRLGLAYDLKSANAEMIQNRRNRTGDASIDNSMIPKKSSPEKCI